MRLKLVTRVQEGTLVSLRQRRDRSSLISIYLLGEESMRLKLVTRAQEGTLVCLRQRREMASLIDISQKSCQSQANVCATIIIGDV